MTTQNTTWTTGKKVAKYALLPGILPRIRELGGSGFGYLAFLIACVYNAVRILPNGHPFTNPANIGKFGIREAVAAAANNIVVSKKNADQIIIFVAVMAAIILMFAQFLGLLFLILSGTAFAADGDAGMFKTQYPKTDIAFMLMDHVFGIKDFFGSSVKTGTPFHEALQALFQFYNMAILVVAVLIFLYYVIVVVAETAQTGVPFGKRFSKIYAPLRLVAAVGLLVPLNYGFNGSQYIVLGMARLGSGLASNGWIAFNKNLQNPMGVENKTLIADAKAPDVTPLLSFFTAVHACREAYKMQTQSSGKLVEVDAYIVNANGASVKFQSTPYQTAVTYSNGGNIFITFGQQPDTGQEGVQDEVKELCGILKIPVNSSPSKTQQGNKNGNPAVAIQEIYYNLADALWDGLAPLGERFPHALYYLNTEMGAISGDPCWESGTLGDAGTCKSRYKPPAAIQSRLKEMFQSQIKAQIDNAIEQARGEADFKISQDILERGWGGAGIWYNKIAELNGVLMGTIFELPSPSQYPKLMETVLAEKKKQDGTSNICNTFSPNQSDGKPMTFLRGDEEAFPAKAMAEAFAYWQCDSPTASAKGLTGNVIWDAMNIIFGTAGLFDMLKQVPDGKGNLPVHPLAQMVAIGKGLLDSSIRNLAYSMVFAVGGGVTGAFNAHLGATLSAMSSFFMSVATIGLTTGFILFYILPFLPFIYFFFAVGKWVKSVFEAMVGAPLWALAHLRIDGDGFSGRSAVGGYYLILEIFLRPILTVVGLIAGMAIFTALIAVLNELFKLVVLNTTGTDLRDPTGASNPAGGSEMDIYRRAIVDQFFFTIVYAVIVYMMATSSFKMIDQVPQGILRWINASGSFGDSIPDATGNLTMYASMGAGIVANQGVGALNQLGSSLGGAAGGVISVVVKESTKTVGNKETTRTEETTTRAPAKGG